MQIDKKRCSLFLFGILLGALTIGGQPSLAFASSSEEGPVKSICPRVKIETNKGVIVIQLNWDKAPITSGNFARYVKEGFYDGTVFHRVIPGFVVQGGGYTREFKKKPTHEPIRNESNNGLSNVRGTIAMARTRDPHSATSQFYINLVDNTRLDYRDGQWGYTVFGRVVEGMEVVDAIARIQTGSRGPFPRDVPLEDVFIVNARCLSAPAEKRD